MIKNIFADLKMMVQYKVVNIVFSISILFFAYLAFEETMNPTFFVYISIFILPVVLFSFVIYLQKVDSDFQGHESNYSNHQQAILSKIASSLIIQMIPLILYIILFAGIRHYQMNYFLFAISFLLTSFLHIMIALSLSILSKSQKILSLSYITYIIIFSSIPFFYEAGLIPYQFRYVLLVSPSYLSSVLIDSILANQAIYGSTMAYLSILIGFVDLGLMTCFVIHPFFKKTMIN